MTGVELPGRRRADGHRHVSGLCRRPWTPTLRLGAARAACACARRGRQPIRLGHAHGAVRWQPQPAGGFTRDATWVTGLSAATAFAQAPDGRLFVAQQGGNLRVRAKQRRLLIAHDSHADGRRPGRARLARRGAAPELREQPLHLRLLHHHSESGTHNRISRFTASGNPTSCRAAKCSIADLPALSSATNHNGGALHFGNDGKLYVAVGDNANSANAPDPERPVRQDAALQRRRHDPDRQPVLRHAG